LKKKNIVSLVSYDILPYNTGGQKSIAQFNEYLGSIADLWVVSTSTNNIQLAKHYTLLPWMKTSLSKFLQLSLFFRIRDLIKKEQINFFMLEHPYMGWLGWLVKTFCNIPLIIHTHNVEYLRFKSLGRKWWPILKWYEQWVLTIADVVFCISEDDKQLMIDRFGLQASKCHVITFGLPLDSIPLDKDAAADKVKSLHNISSNEAIILFNGALQYFPNYQAVKDIIYQINPLLLATNLSYKIIICGKGLPEELNGLKDFVDKNIIYAGLVPDIELYFKAADIFINPVLSGGGIKTKLVEALGYDTTVISAATGALGADTIACGNKLIVIPDNDWNVFAEAIIANIHHPITTPNSFYEEYYWGNIVNKALATLD